MNDQTSKNIHFNKSSLLGLKAELLKKQEEVLAKKQQPQHKVANFKPPLAKNAKNTSDLKEPKKSFIDNLKAVDIEELEACKKSKAALEKKAELYEHLSDAAGNSQLAERFLVDFSLKKQQEAVDRPPNSDDEDTYTQDNEDDEWTEFTDCLGRTRKCLKSDLHLYQKKNIQLSQEVFKKTPEPERDSEWKPPETVKEKPFLVQKTNDYLQSLREKWELKERDLLAKDKDIHYQDLLFDEARQHGVGYYAFSTDEAERQRQMEELTRVRQMTMDAQRESAEARKRRDELVASRVAAARARQRERAGLPPEEPQDTSKDFTACLLEFLNKQKDEADAEAKEKERKIREEEERKRREIREAYVREWDIGKEGVEGKAKRFVEMTQEEYVEKQRSKRIDEFAPPNFASSERVKSTRDKRREPLTEAKTWEQVRPPIAVCPSPPHISEVNEVKGLYFSTNASGSSSKNNTKYSNFVAPRTSKSYTNDMAKDNATESDVEWILNDTTNETPRSNEKYAQSRPPPSLSTFDNTTSKHGVNKQRMKYRNFSEYHKTGDTSEPVDTVNEVEEDDLIGETAYDNYEPVPKKQRIPEPSISNIHETYVRESLDNKRTERKLSYQYDFSLE